MSEQQDVIEGLDDAGVLAAIQWAYTSAANRALETYSPDDGENTTLLGTTRHTKFCDRLDRVFACGSYEIDVEGGDDDVLYSQLSAADIASMPRLAADLVRRADLNQSPGWMYRATRFLLNSYDSGSVDKITWKSPTKRRVASQPDPDPDQKPLFEYLADLRHVAEDDDRLGIQTFVVAHSLDPVSGQRELFFGRPRLKDRGEKAWHWRQNLLTMPPATGGYRPGTAPRPTGPDTTPDAPVRLRPSADEARDGHANGEG